MRIQLDTDKKTIKIEDEVNLNKLFEMVEKLLPKGEWKKYTIESTVIHNWSSPYIIDRFPVIHPYNNQTPFYQTNTPNTLTDVICGTNSNIHIDNNSGVFNIEMPN